MTTSHSRKKPSRLLPAGEVGRGLLGLKNHKRDMKTRKLLYLSAVLAGTLGFTSCELDEYNPTGGDANITSYDAWAGLQTYCYSPLAEQLYSVYDFLSVAEGGTDMWINADKDYAQQLMYYDGLTTNTGATRKLFLQAYSCIASCNAVINNADRVEGGDEATKKQLVAEAKTLRAFYNLLLVTYYGPVTLTQEDVSLGEINTTPTRNTVQEFYTSITTDLKEAANDLQVTSPDGNYARVTKKTALGILARAYAQGAGEGLTEDGVSYWERARDVAKYIIDNKANLNVYLYTDVSDLWAQANNRNNPEALFIVSGRDAYSPSANYVNCNNNLFCYTFCDPNKLEDLYTTANSSNYYLGRVNTNCFSPTKYAIDVFDATWDKRYENTFMTAFGNYSRNGSTYITSRKRITDALAQKYGLSADKVGQFIYPYVQMKENGTGQTLYGNATSQWTAEGVWPKGEHSGNAANLQTDVKNAFVIDYPVALDDDRFVIVLSKEYRTPAEKAQSIYFTVNIDDLYDAQGRHKTEPFDGTNSYQLFPSLLKYNWCYDGVSGSSLQRRNGDMMVIRTAEIYLIAAEASVMLGDASGAEQYLKPLRDRAARPGTQAPALGTITEETILDEYAREMAGEFNRWALLKRHHAFEERLPLYNTRAAENFNPSIHYCRPISSEFLQQIENRDEYGDNGYGTTATKGY